MKLPQKKKSFLNFFFNVQNLELILNIFKKKMTLIADKFFKLRTLKNVVK